MENINLNTVSDITDLVDNFRKNYMDKMYEAKETMWKRYNGNFPNEEKAAVYNDLCTRTDFLQALLDSIIQMSRYVAVCSANIDKFNEGVVKMRIVDKSGEVRSNFVQEQKDFLNTHIQKFKKITETYSTN